MGGRVVKIERAVEGLAGAGPDFSVRGVDGWLQGRTMYGGASSFLAYAAARKARPDLPPLRGGQISFLAPVGSDLDITVASLREGKSRRLSNTSAAARSKSNK